MNEQNQEGVANQAAFSASSANTITIDDGVNRSDFTSTGVIYSDSTTGISYYTWPCTQWYSSGHTHNFFVAHKKEGKSKVKLFLLCTTCGEGRKVEIPI